MIDRLVLMYVALSSFLWHILYYTIPYRTILYYTILYYTRPYETILHYIMLH